MAIPVEPLNWDARAAKTWVRVPTSDDDKYSRGVLCVVTGSAAYPGAAVLSVEAAARTGVGMIRYIGPDEPRRLVLERRPEVVIQPGTAQAFLIGSGIDPTALDDTQAATIESALGGVAPLVIDAGLLGRVADTTAPRVVTPHARELARLLSAAGTSVDEREVSRAPEAWAPRAADEFGATVLLKGAVTHIATPANDRGERFHAVVSSSTHWMASAGTGDVLAGILGALVATHADAVVVDAGALGPLAATAAYIHAQAGERASAGGPLVALDVAEAIPGVIASLV
jgi:hydroxyethylthiazole kinase-like uncharacterized protein yjeF